MARPIELNANTPGGNTFYKSNANSRPYKSKPVNMGPVKTPKMGSQKRSGDKKAAYEASRALDGYNPPIMGGNSMDYASSWMQSKGLKNAQNGGRVPRVPYATVPADFLTAGGNTIKQRSQVSHVPKPAKRTTTKSSSGPTTSRVKVKYTGRNYQNTRKPKIMPARKS